MTKRALIVGIDKYDNFNALSGCVADAAAMAALLARNDDGSINFDCRTLTSPGVVPVTRGMLRKQWNDLFQDFDGDVLFYFSGHGAPTNLGGYLATQDGTKEEP